MHKREVAAKFPPGAGCVAGSTASGRQRHASDSFEHRVGPSKESQRVFERDHTGGADASGTHDWADGHVDPQRSLCVGIGMWHFDDSTCADRIDTTGRTNPWLGADETGGEAVLAGDHPQKVSRDGPILRIGSDLLRVLGWAIHESTSGKHRIRYPVLCVDRCSSPTSKWPETPARSPPRSARLDLACRLSRSWAPDAASSGSPVGQRCTGPMLTDVPSVALMEDDTGYGRVRSTSASIDNQS